MIKRIKLRSTERILAAILEFCAGPGWANAVTWVYILDDATGKLRKETIQPHERSPKLHALFEVGAVVQQQLRDAVPIAVTRGKQRA